MPAKRPANEDVEFRPPGAPLGFKRARTERGRGRGRGISGRGRGRGRGAATGQLQDAEEDPSSLFSMVKGLKGNKNRAIVDEWIDEYNRNPDNALLQLQQFFVSSAGCKGVITMNMMQGGEYSDIIRRMTEEFDEDSSEYPLIMTGPQWKHFKKNFSDFIKVLIDKCKDNIIFDNKMMDGVIQLLTGLSDSQVRAFRHTATHAAMKLCSALVDVAIDLAVNVDHNARQLETEHTKTQKQRAAGTGNERLELLIQRKADLMEKTDDVKQMLQYIFKSVFVHRYRDVLPEIRSTCICELGYWMSKYPQHFLEDSFLKYIGWLLSDKVAEVRLECLKALNELYTEESYQKLELFTNKFKERLVSMDGDISLDVAIQAVALCTHVYRCFPDVLTPLDCAKIYDLVYSSDRNLAVAAGHFLNTKLFENRQNAGGEGNAPLLIDLINFFADSSESTGHNHAAYLVDALLDAKQDMLRDWAAMANLLLANEELNDENESALIDILVCSVKQTVTGEPPIGRSIPKRGCPGGGGGNKDRQHEMIKFTEQLIPLLPALLQKFIADRDQVANLLRLPLYFNLDIYMAGRHEKELDDLMRMFATVIERHSDDEVLEPLAAVFDHLTTNVGVNQHTETARLKLVDGLALQVRQNVQRFHAEERLDEEDEAAMLASFRKVAAFAACIDLSKWDLWDVFYSVLNPNDDSKEAPRDVREKALICCFLDISFDLSRLLADDNAISQAAVDALKAKRDKFISTAVDILRGQASGCEAAYLMLCDTLLLFSWILEEKGQPVSSLVCLPTKSIERQLTEFVIDNVFAESDDDEMNEQQQIALTHKRRNILANFCKLVIHGAVKMSYLSNVLQYYTKFFSDFGDILKTCLQKCRELDKIQCSRAIASALLECFSSMNSEESVADPVSEEFTSLRDLAKRFALTFGPDAMKNRNAIATIHREGILYALKKPAVDDTNCRARILFLEVLIEFSSKLLKVDKQAVIKYLDKYAKVNPAEVHDDPYWQPYLLYRNSLEEKRADDASSIVSGRSEVSTARLGGRGRGRARLSLTPTRASLHAED